MKKTRLIILVCIVALPAALVGLAVHLKRGRDPRVILGWLRDGKGDKTELMMRLSLARGDVLGPMIEHATDPDAPAAFRCDIIDALFKQYQRAADDRIVEALSQIGTDPDAAIRRATAYGIAVFGDDTLQASLVDRITDADPEVRRQAYMVFATMRRRRGIESPPWTTLSDEKKKWMLDTARAAIGRETKTEPGLELNYLARAVVGRQIEILCEQGVRARETGEIDKAERLFRRALAMDPTNQQAQAHLARHFHAIGDKQKTLEMAEEIGALLRIPRLREAPTIDGDPTEQAWGDARTGACLYLTVARFASRLAKGKTTFHIGHRDGRIYIAVMGHEPDLSKLRVTHGTRDSPVSRDDCVELFFDPTMSGTTFCQFLVNPKGALLDIRNQDEAVNFNCETKAAVFKDRGYWCCEFAIDAKELTDAGITPDSMWGINIVRARIGPASEHCQWWPTFGWAARAHLFPIAVFGQ